MKLQDLRKLAIKQKLEIRFQLKNGQECVIDRQGIARVPGLDAPPTFNLEEELAAASGFLVDSLNPTDKKNPTTRRKMTAAEVSAMTGSAVGAGAAADHDDE